MKKLNLMRKFVDYQRLSRFTAKDDLVKRKKKQNMSISD